MRKGFEKLSTTQRVRITSLAGVEVCEEMIPEETKVETLKEIIILASYLASRWDRVWTLAEKRLEVIEEVGRIVCQSRDKEP
jgi:hypothetical protein